MNEQEPQLETGSAYHAKSEQLRESGKFMEALISINHATELYASEGNAIKQAESKSSEFLIHRHWFENTGMDKHKENAQKAIEASVDIIKKSGSKAGLAIPLYNLAKWYQTGGSLEKSVTMMEEALSALDEAPDDPMGLPSVRAEISTRKAAIGYQLGKDAAREQFEAQLNELKINSHPDDYTQNVWVSGAYMHMAEALIVRSQLEEARDFLGKAEEIVVQDSRLKLRVAQIDHLKAVFAQDKT